MIRCLHVWMRLGEGEINGMSGEEGAFGEAGGLVDAD